MGAMGMGMDNSTTAAMMHTAFTASIGSANLWFESWTPSSPAATFGACLGLFALAVLSRFLSAVKVCAEAAWITSVNHHAAQERRAGPIALSQPASPSLDDSKAPRPDDHQAPVPAFPSPLSADTARPRVQPLYSPPFLLAVDLPRSLLFGLQALIAYLVMLAVMTYNAWFFVAVLLGLVAGELAFGRFIAAFGGAAAAHGGHGEGWLHG
ncbi:copper transporter [Rhodotorula diobovata]|uniref:Copper transport protein n=1 Tax=Rhodotorula diobovata TaxID=5288 RepID=A0A5C5FPC9_9BASI|nr:copper transporter [Rhodotorula diobovata]